MNKAKKDELKLSRETRTVQILGFEDESSGALMPPVHFATTFARDAEHYQTPRAGPTCVVTVRPRNWQSKFWPILKVHPQLWSFPRELLPALLRFMH